MMERVEVGGLRIAFRREGEGPPLVLLHGAMCDSRAWRPQLEELSGEFEVIAWDAPGCGASPDPPEHFTLADYGACLAGFLDALGVDRPNVLGLSWGGGLAIELCRQRPGWPRSLILAGAYAGWAGSLPPDAVAERLEGALRESERPPREVAAEFATTFFALPSAALLEEAVAMMADYHPAGTRIMARGFAAADLRHVLPTIDVRTLVLHAEADVRATRAVADALHAGIPGSRLVVLRDVGHVSNLEAPAEFNHAVRSFLER